MFDLFVVGVGGCCVGCGCVSVLIGGVGVFGCGGGSWGVVVGLFLVIGEW